MYLGRIVILTIGSEGKEFCSITQVTVSFPQGDNLRLTLDLAFAADFSDDPIVESTGVVLKLSKH